MVQLESKLSHLMLGAQTNLRPIAQDARLHEFRDQYTDALLSRSNVNQSDMQRRHPDTQERSSDFPIRRVNSMEKISSKLRPEKYSTSRKNVKKVNTSNLVGPGRPYVQMEISSNNPLALSSNTNQKARSRSSLGANEVLSKDNRARGNIGCILNSQQYTDRTSMSPNSVPMQAQLHNSSTRSKPIFKKQHLLNQHSDKWLNLP